MTFESICKKMNFNPLVDKMPAQIAEHDDRPTPFALLTSDELKFLDDYMANAINKMVSVQAS